MTTGDSSEAIHFLRPDVFMCWFFLQPLGRVTDWFSILKKQNIIYGWVFRRVRKIAKSDYLLRHVCPSVRMEQLGSH
jgi:hypothetical protein